ncbi:MAG: acetylglutamate kinase [Acidobacteria bacterium]|nr:acetylglutamate kinase [Acidobacteriota bacterium]
MKLVIKLGGAAVDDRALLDRCAGALAGLTRRGYRVAVVHGGGPALTRTLNQLGKTSEFVDGLRVTDAETRDVAVMVLAGGVNKRLVAALARAGQPALGLCGGDGLAFRARKLPANGRDLGFVGEVCAADPSWLESIWARGALPVVASLALGLDGEYYNINADQMAAACAVACQADALVFLTDVPGVWDAERTPIGRLSTAQIAALAERAVIQGGMLPKLEACRRALGGGVSRVHIVPAAEVDAVAGVLAAKVQLGTEVVAA